MITEKEYTSNVKMGATPTKVLLPNNNPQIYILYPSVPQMWFDVKG